MEIKWRTERGGRTRGICDDTGNAYKTVVIISERKNQRRDGFTMILEEVGINVWGEFERHDVNLHLVFLNKVLHFQAL